MKKHEKILKELRKYYDQALQDKGLNDYRRGLSDGLEVALEVALDRYPYSVLVKRR